LVDVVDSTADDVVNLILVMVLHGVDLTDSFSVGVVAVLLGRAAVLGQWRLWQKSSTIHKLSTGAGAECFSMAFLIEARYMATCRERRSVFKHWIQTRLCSASNTASTQWGQVLTHQLWFWSFFFWIITWCEPPVEILWIQQRHNAKVIVKLLECHPNVLVIGALRKVGVEVAAAREYV